MKNRNERLRKRKMLRKLGFGLSIPVGVVAIAAAASANFGSQGNCGYLHDSSALNWQYNCVSLANNKWHAVRPNVLGNQWDGIDDALVWSIDNNYDPTSLVAYDTTSDSLPDVWAHDYWYGNGPIAWVNCPEDNTGLGSHGTNLTWCRGQDLVFNASQAWQITNQNGRRGVACHELGHTVGLRHSSETASCVYSQVPPTTALTNHDRNHLNFYG